MYTRITICNNKYNKLNVGQWAFFLSIRSKLLIGSFKVTVLKLIDLLGNLDLTILETDLISAGIMDPKDAREQQEQHLSLWFE